MVAADATAPRGASGNPIGLGARTGPAPSEPSWKWSLAPQQPTWPPSSITQVWRSPAATSIAASKTSTGPPIGSASVPSPTCPLPLLPQQKSRRSSRIAQVCSVPAAIRTAGPGSSETSVGVSVRPPEVPRPSWPRSSSAQQKTAPSDRRAQVWRSPAASAIAPEPVSASPGPASAPASGSGPPSDAASRRWASASRARPPSTRTEASTASGRCPVRSTKQSLASSSAVSARSARRRGSEDMPFDDQTTQAAPMMRYRAPSWPRGSSIRCRCASPTPTRRGTCTSPTT